MKRIVYFFLFLFVFAASSTVMAQANLPLPGGQGVYINEICAQQDVEYVEFFNPNAFPVMLPEYQLWEQTTTGSPFYTVLNNTLTIPAGGYAVVTGWTNTIGSGCEAIVIRNALTGEYLIYRLHPGGTLCPADYDNPVVWSGFPTGSSTLAGTINAGDANVTTANGNSLQFKFDTWLECAQTNGSENCPALPIETTFFGLSLAPTKPVKVLGKLVTETEIDNCIMRFQRQDKQDKALFHTRDSLPGYGYGNTVVERTYFFADVSPYSGWNYYRIEQQDCGTGKLSHSTLAAIYVNGDIAVTYGPNPASDVLRITVSGKDVSEGNFTAEIYSVMGQGVVAASIGAAQTELPLGHVPAGIYLVKIMVQDGALRPQEILQFRIVKQ